MCLNKVYSKFFVCLVFLKMSFSHHNNAVYVVAAKKDAKKKKRASSSSSSSSSDSESSSESSSESEESEKESKKRKKKAKKQKEKQKEDKKKYFIYFHLFTVCCVNGTKCLATDPQNLYRSEAESAEEKEQDELVTSTVRPEEIPPIPENRFLMRISPQIAQKPKEEVNKDQRNKDERPRQRCV